MNRFQDLFSGHSEDYAQYRPDYPDELYQYLASLTNQHELAWDCATGTGQAAVKLATYFDKIIATDASEKQVKNALPHPNVTYQTTTAEKTDIKDQSLDLITVAQALHWFNLDKFVTEVKRVLKPGGILAAWTYNLISITPTIDKIVLKLYQDILGEYWSFERKLVEEGYKDIRFPFSEITAPDFTMNKNWTLQQLTGYLNTWSALKQYEKKNNLNPLELVFDELVTAWGNIKDTRLIDWPLTLKIWRL